MDMDYSVPVLDLDAYLRGLPGEAQRLVPEVKRALENIGFLVITGHRIPPDLLARVHEVSKAFFDLPEAEKRLCHDVPGTFLGYNPLGAERVAYSHGIETAPDLKANFTVGRPTVDERDPYFTCPAGRGMFQTNVWPARPPDFQAAMLEYFRVAEALALELMSLFAVTLGLPARFFDAHLDKASNFLRVLDYPALEHEPLPNQFRIGPHSDYGTLTLVVADGPGLQVRTPDGVWEDVPYVPGAIQVNIGDMLERWTNDLWVSTQHRVLVPADPQERARRRHSIAFFQMANYDVVIEPLPNTVSATRPASYAPITAGEDFMEKTSRQYSKAGQQVTDIRSRSGQA